MAKWVEFTVIEVQRTGPQSANIIKIEHIPVNADKVVMVIPTIIPSDISGPDGAPSQRPGAMLSFVGAGLQCPAVMVESTKEEVLWKLEHGPFVEVTEPKENPEPKRTGKPTLKLIKPNE